MEDNIVDEKGLQRDICILFIFLFLLMAGMVFGCAVKLGKGYASTVRQSIDSYSYQRLK